MFVFPFDPGGYDASPPHDDRYFPFQWVLAYNAYTGLWSPLQTKGDMPRNGSGFTGQGSEREKN